MPEFPAARLPQPGRRHTHLSRSSQGVTQLTDANAFASAHDEQTRVQRLPHQDFAGTPAGKLQDPFGMRRYGVEHCGDPPPIGVLELLGAHVHEVRRRGKPGGAELRPVKHVHGSQHGPDAPGLLSRPIQHSLTRPRIIESYDDPHPAPPQRRAASFTPPALVAPSYPEQSPLVVLGEDLRPSHPTPFLYAYVLLAGEHQSGLRTDVCVTLGSSMLPNHPVG